MVSCSLELSRLTGGFDPRALSLIMSIAGDGPALQQISHRSV